MLIWKRERRGRWTIVPDKPYSYCNTKLGCPAQNVLGEAFQLHKRWRPVQDSLVYFKGKKCLLKITITFFTRATFLCLVHTQQNMESLTFIFTKWKKIPKHSKIIVCRLRSLTQLSSKTLFRSHICKPTRLLQEIISNLVNIQRSSKIHKLVPEC